MAGAGRQLLASELEDLLMARYKHDKFHLWLDRQTRPTVGATVEWGVGRTRQEIGDALFLEILRVLTKELCQLIPTDALEGVYLTYSIGRWQRANEFHMKAHLPTEVFLTLADNLARPNTHALRTSKEELERRGANDHRGPKLKEVFVSTDKREIKAKGKYHFFVSTQLNYPLLCLYYKNDEDKLTPNFSSEQLPNALRALEGFVLTEWKQAGFSIGMVISGQQFNVAAIVEEDKFAGFTGKKEEDVKESWGWREPKRRYHPYQQGGNTRFQRDPRRY